MQIFIKDSDAASEPFGQISGHALEQMPLMTIHSISPRLSNFISKKASHF